jgi:biotin transport system substrate-specific component
VLLVGASLGAVRGAASLTLYAVLGLAGLPIFAPQDDGSHLTGLAALAAPSFGYIIGFIASAAIVGWAAERSWDRGWFKPIVTFIGGSLVVFAVGLPWLAVALGQFGLPNDLQSVLVAGFYPFIIGGLIKAAIAAALLPALWAVAGRSRRSE